MSQPKSSQEIEEEKKAKIEEEKNKGIVDFVRKDTRPGVYSTKGIGKAVVIKDRQHYVTRIKSEIEFFNNDPEIVVFDTGKKKLNK